MIFEIVCTVICMITIMFLTYTCTSFVVYMLYDWGIFRPDGRIDMYILIYVFITLVLNLVVLGVSIGYVIKLANMI